MRNTFVHVQGAMIRREARLRMRAECSIAESVHVSLDGTALPPDPPESGPDWL